MRKRHNKLSPRNKWKNLMDKAIYFAVIFGIIITIPQLTNIWLYHNAAGVSAISWGGYLVVAVFWLIYGILHKEKPIIFTNICWIFLQSLIVIGTLLYR